jgi:hypothetical protein
MCNYIKVVRSANAQMYVRGSGPHAMRNDVRSDYIRQTPWPTQNSPMKASGRCHCAGTSACRDCVCAR